MTALLLIDLTELALPQPRVSRRAPSAASVRRRKAATPPSFATSLQRARTADEALARQLSGEGRLPPPPPEVHSELYQAASRGDLEAVDRLLADGRPADASSASEPSWTVTASASWAYWAPEMFAPVGTYGKQVDMWSLGVILYTMLTGRRPFVAEDMSGYLEQHQKHDAKPPIQLVPGTPPQLNSICMRLLQKSPRNRFQSAQEILYQLEQIDIEGADHEENEVWEPPLVGRN